jgi:hypothetical protein
MSTTDLSHNAKGARSQPSGRGHRVSASAENGTTNAAPTPIDDTNTTHLKDQLPWAPVLLNPQRLASAAIGALRGGANYASQLASIVTGGSPIGPKKGDRRFVCSVFFCGNPLTPVRLGQIAGQIAGCERAVLGRHTATSNQHGRRDDGHHAHAIDAPSAVE